MRPFCIWAAIQTRPMHYYQHHIGDFNNATRHLNRIERSVYRDLLDAYYESERPLPADLDRLARLMLCTTPEERTALETVLAEFFTVQDGCYRNARADREIESYQRMSAGGKRGAETRWTKARTQPSYTHHIPPLCPPQPEGNSNQEPITNNQEKDIVGQAQPSPPDEAKQKRLQEERQRKSEASEVLEYLNASASRSYRAVDANLTLITARLKDGVTVDQLKAVVTKKCRDWGGDLKMKDYLRPATLFNRTNFEQYLGELGSATVPTRRSEVVVREVYQQTEADKRAAEEVLAAFRRR